MKFSELQKGIFARRRVTVELGGKPVAIDVRAVSPAEEGAIIAGAIQFAKDRGIANPCEGDTLYDLGIWVHTLAVACVDPESPEDTPRPFFDGGAPQILDSELLTRQHLAYLAEHQEDHQDTVSPYQRDLPRDELLTRVRAIAEGNIDFFLQLRPAIRWRLVRSMAIQQLDSLGHKLLSGGSQAESAPGTSAH